jgi:hypothetical protein
MGRFLRKVNESPAENSATPWLFPAAGRAEQSDEIERAETETSRAHMLGLR